MITLVHIGRIIWIYQVIKRTRSTTDKQELSAETGDTIHAKIMVEIGASGIYTVMVTGEKSKGSVSFTVENEQ